jgi:preprotein translocase subunit SecF
MKYFQLLPKTNIDFVGLRKLFFVFSGLIVLACVFSIVTKGMNYGIDFTGGTMVQAQFENGIDISRVRAALSKQNINADIQTFADKNSFAIRIKGSQENINEATDKVKIALDTLEAPFVIAQVSFVGPTVGAHLAKKAIFAFILALGAMIIYIGFRFRNIIWGAMAALALFHDVLVTAGVFSIMRLEVDLVIVAAFLTIAGYSLNDTIVIFDRVRENIKLHPKKDLKDVLNLSVNETLSRTIITSLSVFVAVAILFFMGGEVLHNFSLAMIIGTLAGVYSTVALVIGAVYQFAKDGGYSADRAVAVAQSGFENPKRKNKKRHG